MAKPSHWEALMGGFLGAPPTQPKRISRQELLKAGGVSDRQLRYFIKCGAVRPPIGKTRGASYTLEHLSQVKRVVQLQKNGMTVAQVAEAYAKGKRDHLRKAAPLRPSSAIRETVYPVTNGIRVVAAEELLPSEQALLRRLLRAGETTSRERQSMMSESLARHSRGQSTRT